MLIKRNDITKVKEINVEYIKTTLKNLGNATKAQIADETDISVATCGKILNELCATGEVLEVAETSSGYGRPAKSYAYNGDFAVIACVYVETIKKVTRIYAVVSNLLGKIQEEFVEEIEEVTYEVLENQVEKLKNQYEKLQAVAVGIPGFITDDVVDLCSYESLVGVPLQKKLQEKLPEVHILVENDMNAAAFGYYKNSYEDNHISVAFIFSPPDILLSEEEKIKNKRSFSINLGAGFVSNGKILRGSTGFAGEVAFLPLLNQKGNTLLQTNIDAIAYIIGSIAPILNPQIVALTGKVFNEENIEEIRQKCLQAVNEQHMPKIIMRNDIHDDYINGLLNLAMEELSCSVELVKRKV